MSGIPLVLYPSELMALKTSLGIVELPAGGESDLISCILHVVE